MRRRRGVQRRRGGRSRRLVNAGCSGCPPAACRCWPAAAVWSGPRAAESRFVTRHRSHRSRKTGAAIPRGESGLCDPRRPTPPPAHRCAWHVPPKRIPTRRGGERSEGTSRDGFPDRGSRPSTASAGATRVPAARSPPSPIVITSLSGFRETPARFRASVPAAAGSCRSCPPRLQPGGLQCVANSGETPDDDRCAHHGPPGKTPAGPRKQQDPVGTVGLSIWRAPCPGIS